MPHLAGSRLEDNGRLLNTKVVGWEAGKAPLSSIRDKNKFAQSSICG